LLAADATTGRFDVGPYPPGDWCIRAISTSGAGSTSAKHTLVAGETWDFGDIQIVRGAVVVVKLDCRCGSVATPIRAQLRDETGWMESLTIEEGEGHSGRLAPGHYVLTVEREGCAKLERDVEVRSEDLHFAVELHAP
jgi:hypothetical protein